LKVFENFDGKKENDVEDGKYLKILMKRKK
jgi:hypothetical protein